MAGAKGRSGGRNRKPLHVHLVRGSYRRDRHGPLDPPPPSRVVDNGLEPPKRLKKRQRELWDRHIRILPDLIPLDAAKAHMWVELQAEWERAPTRMPSSRLSQLRLLAKDLGMG